MNACRHRAAIALLALAGCSEPATVATFNIRFFPDTTTDREAVTRTIAQMNADVIAVQEIRHAEAFEKVLENASERTGRDYRYVGGPCGGEGVRLTTGVVYDASRMNLVAERRYKDLGRSETCGSWLPATVAVLEKGRRELIAASIHFEPFPERYDQRTQQWPRALELMADLEREFEPDASLMMGDTNSTGFRGEPREEPDFVRSTVRDAGRELLTDDTACTEYWLPPEAKAYQPSLLDHIVTRGGDWDDPQVQGLCARLECESAPNNAMDPEFSTVSDHCPVVVTGKL